MAVEEEVEEWRDAPGRRKSGTWCGDVCGRCYYCYLVNCPISCRLYQISGYVGREGGRTRSRCEWMDGTEGGRDAVWVWWS